jgi:hypothetical protein
MKKTREIEEEKEGFNGNNIYKKKNSLNITMDKIDLCNLPIDILNVIIIQKTTFLEKHIFRFVCKKLHDIVHRISYYSSILFHNSKKFDELAAKYVNLDIFKWVVSTLCTVKSRRVCYYVARYSGNVKLIRYAKVIGYPLYDSICDDAVKGGHFKILKWAKENNYNWSGKTCAEAAYGGHFKILKWARENNCPWDERTCSGAVIGGHFEALRAALARNTKMGQRK